MRLFLAKSRTRRQAWFGYTYSDFALAAVLGCVLLLAPAARAQTAGAGTNQNYDPIANPRAVVTLGHARFTVLTPRLIRMEWSADGQFENHASLVFLNRRLPVPAFTVQRDGNRLTLSTSALHLNYDAASADGGKFAPGNLSIQFLLDGKKVTWHPGMADTGNLQGTARTLDGARGSHLKAPMGQGLISRDGWSLVDDSKSPLFTSDDFDFAQGENSPWPWVIERPAHPHQDWYFFGYGHHYRQALHAFTLVAGRIPLPPRFVFGIWWSRYWAYSDQELDHLIQGFHENDTPLNVLVIDMDWHINQRQLAARHETDQSGQALGWTGYTFNHVLFPYPKQFLAHLHREGLKVTLNLHPASGIQPWEKAYPAMARAMGINPATKKYVPFEPTNERWARNYFKLVLHPLEREGVNFWWLDWQQQPNTNLPNLTNLRWINYLHFSDQEREGKRPLIMSRWGGLGGHRYEIGFSGDTISVWPSLAFQPWFTATAANVGFAYWSHDIGGHMPGAVSPQLFTRWVEFGAYSPVLRTHTTKNPDAERRIWAYPEPYASILRKVYQHRMALVPYIYTEARRTYDTGLAFLHPLYYNWPNAAAAYTNKDEYMFGSELLVSPVTRAVDAGTQLAKESLWIPPGTWVSTATGAQFAGPREITRNFSIDQTPVFARAGAIIPMQPAMLHDGQKPVDPLILRIYPLANHQTSTYTLYDDSGKTRAYEHGAATWTRLSAAQADDELTVNIAAVRGGYPGMIEKRAYKIELPGAWPPRSVTVNGKPVPFTGRGAAQPPLTSGPGWRYAGNTIETVITTPAFSVHTPVRVEVRREPGSLAARGELNGFAGSTDRLREAYDTLNSLWPFTWAPEPLIEAWETGDRLSYHPEDARAQLARFPGLYAQAIAAVRKLIQKADVPEGQLIQQLMRNKGLDTTRARAERYKPDLQRALALLEDGQPGR